VDSPLSSLIVSVTSSNAAIVPDENVVLGGSGAARTLTLRPRAGATASSVITLSVSDGASVTTSSFVYNVIPD
jgi:hypothetical protein